MALTPLMPKATAVWLIDNTSMTFQQIAAFCRLHPLEVTAIADGDSAQGIKGIDPVINGQVDRDEIEAAEKDPAHKMKLKGSRVHVPETKRRAPRYTPVSKRQDRPNAIMWLVRNHPELKDAQVIRLVGTTKPTIQAIRDRTHWNAANLAPVDPVTLGLCSQLELDMEVGKATKTAPPPEAEGVRLLSAEESTRIGTTDFSPELSHSIFSGDGPVPATDAPPKPEAEPELDADSVFAKLKSLKSEDL
ncbi:MAG: DUF1013 domain-containing protein [Alphaproteobacteria bacterium]